VPLRKVITGRRQIFLDLLKPCVLVTRIGMEKTAQQLPQWCPCPPVRAGLMACGKRGPDVAGVAVLWLAPPRTKDSCLDWCLSFEVAPVTMELFD